jgi:hypothetical protein
MDGTIVFRNNANITLKSNARKMLDKRLMRASKVSQK